MATLEDVSLSEAIDPARASGAQIPLQAFTIPEFPPGTQSLKALTLTSDIKLDEYSSLLKDFSTIPQLPKGIESLTLELFSLGYPPGFLNSLSQQLPNIKSLVLYSQLLDGITADSQQDAVRFFENLTNLRALHLLDVFVRPHFLNSVGGTLADREKGLLFLEINYSFRHEDEEFLTRVPAGDLPALISPSLITLALNISLPDATNDPDDPANLTADGEEANRKHEGVMAFNTTLAPVLIDALTRDETAPRNLKLLNTTLYTISVEELQRVLEKHKSLLVLNATVHLEPTEECKKALLDALSACKDLEQVEIVVNPSLQFYIEAANPKSYAIHRSLPSQSDMSALSSACPKLVGFKANVLRTTAFGSCEWAKEGGIWKGGITKPGRKEDVRASAPAPIEPSFQVSA